MPKPGNPDPVSQSQSSYALTERIDAADDFMTGNDGKDGVG